MSTLMLDPSGIDASNERAARVADCLRRLQQGDLDVTLNVQDATVDVSSDVAQAFVRVMDALARGKRVRIYTEEEEMTTTEAAQILNVSRPHLVKLLKEGQIPFHKVGSHRRVYRDDILEYKSAQNRKAEEAMQRLAEQAQERDLGY